MTAQASFLLLGSCNTIAPLNRLDKAGRRSGRARVSYGPLPRAYTFGEMLQLVHVLRGEADVPQELRPLTWMTPDFRGLDDGGRFTGVEAVLMEPSAPYDFIFRSCHLNRSAIERLIGRPLRMGGKEATQCANRWYLKGLIGMDEEVRAQAVEDLMAFIPTDLSNPELFVAVIRETRCVGTNVAVEMRRLASMFDVPVGVITYVHLFMADGRAISWPAGFLEEVKAAAADLGLPLFEPSKLAIRYGLTSAFKEDLRHYSEEFLPVVGEAITRFADEVRDTALAPVSSLRIA